MAIKIFIKRSASDRRVGLIGNLTIKDESGNVIFQCNTCENFDIGSARNKDLAIPSGKYHICQHRSSKFKNGITDNVMALIYNDAVPKDRYILIHAGNSHVDTAGCILLGIYDKAENQFINSRLTIDAFYTVLYTYHPEWEDGSITLEVE